MKDIKVSIWSLISVIAIGFLIIFCIFSFNGYKKGKKTKQELDRRTQKMEEYIEIMIKTHDKNTDKIQEE